MSQQAPLARAPRRTAERQPNAPLQRISASLAGPQQGRLKSLEACLSQTPPVQRIIFSALGHPPSFQTRGRAGPHNTADNRNGLAALRLHREQNPAPHLGHANNELESNVVINHANSTVGTGLHMAHHVSDAVIQAELVAAVNAYNLAPAQNLALWAPIAALIAGIQPPAILNVIPDFYLAALAAYHQAQQALGALQAVHPVPHTPARDVQLTALAHAIANSPMNLHHGDGRTNMSLGRHGDPNNHPLLGLGGRRMSMRTEQMRAFLAAANVNTDDRSHADAANMDPTSLAHYQATVLFPGMPPASIHNSASGFF